MFYGPLLCFYLYLFEQKILNNTVSHFVHTMNLLAQNDMQYWALLDQRNLLEHLRTLNVGSPIFCVHTAETRGQS